MWQAVEGRYSQQPLLGNSPLIRQVAQLIEQLRDSSVEVLITGESGTGKELIARALHYTTPVDERVVRLSRLIAQLYPRA